MTSHIIGGRGGNFLRKSIKSLINVKRRWETGRSPPRGKPIKKVSLPQTLVCLVASPFSFYQSHIPGGEVFMRRDPKHNPGPLWVFPKESLNKTFIHLPCFLKHRERSSSNPWVKCWEIKKKLSYQCSEEGFERRTYSSVASKSGCSLSQEDKAVH